MEYARIVYRRAQRTVIHGRVPNLCSLCTLFVLTTALLLGLWPVLAVAADFPTPVALEDIDQAVSAQWNDGQETPYTFSAGAQEVLTTRQRLPNHATVTFGVSEAPGVRHLRIGFKRPMPVGTVVVRGDCAVSVLRPAAAYPGNLGDDAMWLPATRQNSTGEAESGAALWTLPAGTTTRALRFTATSPASAPSHAGKLGGVMIRAERWRNIAAEAAVVDNLGSPLAATLTHRALPLEPKRRWDNGLEGAAVPVSPEHAPWILCTWLAPVTIDALGLFDATFSQVEVQTYAGPDTLHPREAGDAQWTTVGTFGTQDWYPSTLPISWVSFDGAVTTRGLRLRIVQPADEALLHPHRKTITRDGKRVFLGKLLVLQNLDSGKTVGPTQTTESLPPIPVRFTLPEAGLVTLVIEKDGVRVRNLVGETPFPAGENVAYWDGLDESGKINEAYHGVYEVRGALVTPGSYTVRGLWHKPLDLRYEFTAYNSGNPPWWPGHDGSGGWLADHSPPSAVLYLPDRRQIMIGAPVAEAGDGVIFVDIDGRKKTGKRWVGGTFNGASHLARDAGGTPCADYYAYSGCTGVGKSTELRLYGYHAKGETRIAEYAFPRAEDVELGGLAVHNGLLVASLPRLNQLLVVDVATKQVKGTLPVERPQGVAFDAQGRLLVVSGKTVLRATPAAVADLRWQAETVIGAGLDDPRQLLVGPQGELYVSDWGRSHQVKCFETDGRLRRVFGNPGGARVGKYDPKSMQRPYGLSLDDAGRLWVAEFSYTPKRVSVWASDGQFREAFYGPPAYGGGGTIDPQDRTRFYYADSRSGEGGTLEFALDWGTGESRPARILYLHGPESPGVALPGALPQTAVYVAGRQYFINAFNSNPVSLAPAIGIWMARGDGLMVPVAAAGQAQAWKALNGEAFKDRWPTGVDRKKAPWDEPVSFVWSDANGDGIPQPEEVEFRRGVDASANTVYVGADLGVTFSSGLVLPVSGFHENGAPRYDLADAKPTVKPNSPRTQLANFGDGWLLGIGGPLRGYRDGVERWTYPNRWPGLHAGQTSGVAFDTPGQLVATTRLMGAPVVVSGERLWAINGNTGNNYLLTPDGLFVATLFKAFGPAWGIFPSLPRDALVNDLTCHGENFWPTINQTADGKVYLVTGQTHCSIVRVDGLDTLRRLPEQPLPVTAGMLGACADYVAQSELRRQQAAGRDTHHVSIREQAPVVDGKLDDWGDARWVLVGSIIRGANQPLPVQAAAAVTGERLYVALKTPDDSLLVNKGDSWQMLFKTGGGLDLMLNTEAHGDQRLLVALVNKKPLAVRYRPKAAESAAKVPFSSPWRTITFDEVLDVSAGVELLGAGGNYELSVPLATLGLKPSPGLRLKGDIGILRGSGGVTAQRLYWQNKATGLVSDVPGEAELAPKLWGWWEFTK